MCLSGVDHKIELSICPSGFSVTVYLSIYLLADMDRDIFDDIRQVFGGGSFVYVD